MCESSTIGNKVLVCDVGDLRPGQQYRTPSIGGAPGEDILVCESLNNEDTTTTVCIRTGTITMVPSATHLGRDRCGRLYASRYLNPVSAIDMNTEFNDIRPDSIGQ